MSTSLSSNMKLMVFIPPSPCILLGTSEGFSQSTYLQLGTTKSPLRIQLFLWLFSQNKIITRDILMKRGMPKPLECDLCKEIESVRHLFFDCIVARLLWEDVFEVFDIHVINFESIASKWLCNKRFLHFNVVTAAILWGVWNNRNNIVFNRVTWINMKQVRNLILLYPRNWKIPFKDLEGGKMDQFMDKMLHKLKTPLPLPGWNGTALNGFHLGFLLLKALHVAGIPQGSRRLRLINSCWAEWNSVRAMEDGGGLLCENLVMMVVAVRCFELSWFWEAFVFPWSVMMRAWGNGRVVSLVCSASV